LIDLGLGGADSDFETGRGKIGKETEKRVGL
jgi:hypothetical protein